MRSYFKDLTKHTTLSRRLSVPNFYCIPLLLFTFRTWSLVTDRKQKYTVNKLEIYLHVTVSHRCDVTLCMLPYHTVTAFQKFYTYRPFKTQETQKQHFKNSRLTNISKIQDLHTFQKFNTYRHFKNSRHTGIAFQQFKTYRQLQNSRYIGITFQKFKTCRKFQNSRHTGIAFEEFKTYRHFKI